MRTSGWTIGACLLVAMLAAGGCRVAQDRRAVWIDSNEQEANVFSSWLVYGSAPVPGQPAGLLLRDGDVLTGDHTLLEYRASDGARLRVQAGPWCTRLAGRVVSLALAEDSARAWLRAAPAGELAQLRYLAAEDSLDAATMEALGRLAQVRPDAGWMLDSRVAISQVLGEFRPRSLMLFDGAESAARYAAGLTRVETLVLHADKAGSLDLLGQLPRLRRLALFDWNVKAAGALPAGLSGLRSLAVLSGEGLESPAALAALPAALEELSLVATNEPADVAVLARLPALGTLILDGSAVAQDFAAIPALRRLRWLGVPTNISDPQFARVLARQPDLEVLEVVNADSLTDLRPLRGLTHLRGFVQIGRGGHLEALEGLTSLRFVGLEADTTRESQERLAALRRKLPDALVVPLNPIKFCLGSGWILVLAPLTAGLWWLLARGRRGEADGT
jgi:hypothetical protein